MSIDRNNIQYLARLARIALSEEEIVPIQEKINAILSFVEELNTVKVDHIQPTYSVITSKLKQRLDEVTERDQAQDLLRNAPEATDHFFLVPKMIE